MINSFWDHRSLVWQLLLRDIHSRYKGSLMGLVWSIVTPLLMLLIYTFVFQYVFKARWSSPTETGDSINFAMVLFLGLITHGLFADILMRSPILMLSHANFVKKVVFPLEILPWVTLLSAIFNFFISFILLLVFVLYEMNYIPLTALFLPIIWIPFIVMILGFSFILSALGVYIRDIQQISGTLVTLTLFLSPIFYSIDILPPQLQTLMLINPIALIVEQSRAVLVYGLWPDFIAIGIYSVVALFILFLGYKLFQKSRIGFADVL